MPSTKDGSAAQPGSPDTRSVRAAARASSLIRPLRWPAISTAMAAVASAAPAVAPIASPMAAPPAGSSPVACAKRISLSMCKSPSRVDSLRGCPHDSREHN
jgi:hypothetical protein